MRLLCLARECSLAAVAAAADDDDNDDGDASGCPAGAGGDC